MKSCEAVDCFMEHYARGLCKKHYAQTLRHGRLTPESERGAVSECKAEGCGRTSDEHDLIRGYCRKHDRQIKVSGRLTPETERMFGIKHCGVRRCKDPVRAKGLCASHYNKRRWQEKSDWIKAQRRETRVRDKRAGRKIVAKLTNNRTSP